MSMKSPFEEQSDPLLNDINMTPFIDVMLVLLIVFMIALPVVNHAVKIDLPRASIEKMAQDTQAIDLAISANGDIHWNKEALTQSQLLTRLDTLAAQTTTPDIRLFADRAVEYGRVAWVMTSAQQRGLTKIDFVLQPDKP
ncbi:TPA: ExbD/TolR family protein [Klebsiella variicola subsp. variicola]|uniref:ExbD/TolR family protein n=1 Tax=Klebsiella variicola TaxID=244366 RepID=UPI00125A4EDB|nr:biopolymer transporter ExbD [Klebsiella variicola]MCX2362005.1 biopolymer transporter ExbD [Klebsiella variicola]VAT76797.1 biopolymer transport protein ExbD/TolR [Klebsiella variicola]HDK6468932.1 biopolymer transporter ExbD [Klebsiella variicola]HDZ0569290.1 biopolymer transporter ExbD [Klebsiella quasipneumoniae]